MNFSDRLAQLMSKYGTIAAELSDRSGVSRSYISLILRTGRSPSRSTALRLLESLGATEQETQWAILPLGYITEDAKSMINLYLFSRIDVP